MKFSTILLITLLSIFFIAEIAQATRLRTRKHHHHSDIRLKTDLKMISTLDNGVEIYSWSWNKLAEAKGLSGRSVGVIAQQVTRLVPGCVSETQDGYLKVNYSKIFTQ